MKLKISIGQIIGLIAVLSFVLFLIYVRIFPSKFGVTVTHTDPQNYIQLFNNSAQKKLKLSATTNTKQHNPIVEFIYKKYYHLQVFKIDNISNKSLKDLIVESAKEPNKYGSFDGVTSGDCDILYREGIHKIHALQFKINGNRVDVEKKSNDQLYIYINNLSSFLVAYEINGDAYIRGETGRVSNNPANDSCEMLFLKKDNFLYFIFIASEVKGICVKPGMLQEIITLTGESL